jgi:hypothetical protein
MLTLGCTDHEKLAKEAIEATVLSRDQINYKSFEGYPGDVLCGGYEVLDRWGENKGLIRFIYQDGELADSVSDDDWAILCSADPAASLYEESGIDVQGMDKKVLSQIRKDLASLEDAISKQKSENVVLMDDPWGKPYIHIIPWYAGVGSETKFQTLGADGEEGGKDENADIGNWHIKYIDHIEGL